MYERLKAACTALKALVASLAQTTAEIFLSELPWAIARTLILELPRELKKRPATPDVEACCWFR
jgi:hypothetical protein